MPAASGRNAQHWRRCSVPADWFTATCSKVPTARRKSSHTIEDWIIERAYQSVPGVADDSGFGGPDDGVSGPAGSGATVRLSPAVVQVLDALYANNANAGGGFYSQGGQFYYVRGLAW